MSDAAPKVITLPHKNLRHKSRNIRSIDDRVHELIRKMSAATLAWEEHREHEVGVALAAIQINELWRAIIVRESFEDKTNKNFVAYLNPEIIKATGKQTIDYEGCLSVKDIYGLVPRYEEVEISAMNLEGETITEKVTGFRARVMQHEIDHLNGILFIDHIKDYDAFFKLDNEGELNKLKYDKVIASRILW